VQNHCRDLRHGYDHLLRYTKTTQALKTSQSVTFRRCYGTEFTSRAILKWANENDVEWHYIDPGKPQQNAFIEHYNRTVCGEWLSQYIFETTQEAQDQAIEWLWVYNNERPNMRIGGITPAMKLTTAALILRLDPVKNGGLPISEINQTPFNLHVWRSA